MNNMNDPFENLFLAFRQITVDERHGLAKAAILLVQDLRSRSDIPKDDEDMIYLEEIQKRAVEILNADCDKLCPLDGLGTSKQHGITEDMRDKYDVLCADIGNLTVKFNPSIGHAFGALL